MKMEKTNFILVIILAFCFNLFSYYSVQAAPKKVREIIVGANPAEYKKPTKRQCNINVPAQYSTIQGAVDAAVVGNTVCVGVGAYNENVIINKSIRLSGSGAAMSIINGQTIDATVYIAGDGNANNVIVEGFLIRGVDGTGLNDSAAFNIGPFASGTIVRYNRIVAGNAGLAVRADSGQNNELIFNNIFEGNNSPNLFKIVGVQGPSDKVDFMNNTFTGTVNQTYPDSGRVLETWATNSLIQRNVFDTTGDITSLVNSSYPSNVVSENNFNSSVTLKVGTYSGGTLNAENNWWGDLDPSDNIQGNVDFTPFASKPFNQYFYSPTIFCSTILCDNFNTYSDGSIVGQGGWENYVNGSNWLVQRGSTFEGGKALYNNTFSISFLRFQSWTGFFGR